MVIVIVIVAYRRVYRVSSTSEYHAGPNLRRGSHSVTRHMYACSQRKRRATHYYAVICSSRQLYRLLLAAPHFIHREGMEGQVNPPATEIMCSY